MYLGIYFYIKKEQQQNKQAKKNNNNKTKQKREEKKKERRKKERCWAGLEPGTLVSLRFYRATTPLRLITFLI